MPHPKVKIADNSGNEVAVTSNALDVNIASGTADIDIGDVSLLLGGTAASVNNGAADATTLRVTIASDTTGVLSVDDNGSSLTVDGTFWQTTQPVSLASVPSHAVTNAGTFAVQSTLQAGSAAIGKLTANSGVDIGDVDVTSIVPGTGATNLGKVEDDQHTTEDVGVMALAVRKDSLTSAVSNTGDYTSLLVNEDGGLWVTLDVTTGNNKYFNIASTAASSSQYGSIPLIKMNEVVSAPSGHVDNDWTFFQTDLKGSLYTTHGITGGADGITTDDTNGTVLGGDVNCKKIDIQALTDNTGVIAVGFTGVDATVATGTGILLNAGDIYSLEINNLNLIYIEASVNTDGVRYTYFT